MIHSLKKRRGDLQRGKRGKKKKSPVGTNPLLYHVYLERGKRGKKAQTTFSLSTFT